MAASRPSLRRLAILGALLALCALAATVAAEERVDVVVDEHPRLHPRLEEEVVRTTRTTTTETFDAGRRLLELAHAPRRLLALPAAAEGGVVGAAHFDLPSARSSRKLLWWRRWWRTTWWRRW